MKLYELIVINKDIMRMLLLARSLHGSPAAGREVM